MKKIIIFTAFALTTASIASAQVDLLAGMDFSNQTAGNYSDLTGDGPAAAAISSFSFIDIVGGSFPTTQYQSSNAITAGSFFNSNNRTASINDEFAFVGGSLGADDVFSGTSADGSGIVTPGFFDFSVDTSSYSLYTDFNFGFAAGQTLPGSSNVEILYDAGSGFNSLGLFNIDANSNVGGEAITTGNIAGVTSDNITFRVSFADIADGTGILFDNLQISGTVVPEPSTYAAIFGAIALGFVVYRRRK